MSTPAACYPFSRVTRSDLITHLLGLAKPQGKAGFLVPKQCISSLKQLPFLVVLQPFDDIAAGGGASCLSLTFHCLSFNFTTIPLTFHRLSVTVHIRHCQSACTSVWFVAPVSG